MPPSTPSVQGKPGSQVFSSTLRFKEKGPTPTFSGELIIALKGIFASVDAKIFREFEKETAEHNPNTQALNSITTFVIDSMSDDDD